MWNCDTHSTPEYWDLHRKKNPLRVALLFCTVPDKTWFCFGFKMEFHFSFLKLMSSIHHGCTTCISQSWHPKAVFSWKVKSIIFSIITLDKWDGMDDKGMEPSYNSDRRKMCYFLQWTCHFLIWSFILVSCLSAVPETFNKSHMRFSVPLSQRFTTSKWENKYMAITSCHIWG